MSHGNFRSKSFSNIFASCSSLARIVPHNAFSSFRLHRDLHISLYTLARLPSSLSSIYVDRNFLAIYISPREPPLRISDSARVSLCHDTCVLLIFVLVACFAHNMKVTAIKYSRYLSRNDWQRTGFRVWAFRPAQWFFHRSVLFLCVLSQNNLTVVKIDYVCTYILIIFIFKYILNVKIIKLTRKDSFILLFKLKYFY